MSSPVLRGGNLVVSEESIRDGVRQVLLPLWSTYYFFSLYAGAANSGAGITTSGVTAATELATMDRYVLARSEEHTSELQSRGHLVCRLLLEKKKSKTRI